VLPVATPLGFEPPLCPLVGQNLLVFPFLLGNYKERALGKGISGVGGALLRD